MVGSTESADDVFDVAIVGAGGAGGVLAACLSQPDVLDRFAAGPSGGASARQTLRIALIEQSSPHPAVADGAIDMETPDQRGLVLTLGSVALLERAHLWPHLAAHATAITGVHISRRHTFGTLQLHAAALGLPALARVVQANRLQHALEAQLTHLARTGGLTLLRPCQVLGRVCEGRVTRLNLKDASGEYGLRARLVVAADGTDSPLAEAAGLPVVRHDYGQTALVAVLAARPLHHGIAVERFTSSGPLALLPIPEGRRVCVLVLATDEADAVMRDGPLAYLARVREVMGPRLGDLELRTPIRPWPLQRVLRDSFGEPGLALIGNAAHTVHPNGAQGLNLGLADVRELVGRIAHAASASVPLASADFIEGFRRARRRDQRAVTLGSHLVARVTRWPGVWGAGAYHAGFGLVDCLPQLKRAFVWRATGLHGETA